MIVLILGYSYFLFVKEGPLQQSTSIVVVKGSSLQMVLAEMKKAEIVEHPLLFEIVARASGVDRKIKSGEYMFSAKVSLQDAWKQLLEGKVFYRRVTLPEGLTTFQFLEILKNESYLSGEITVEVEEGEMLPETYAFSRGDSRNSIIIHSKKAMGIVLNDAWENRKDFTLKEKKDLLILASIVEKETSIPSERRTVASVFVNRLNINMRLQTDPTVIYALTKGERSLGRSLKKPDMKINSPYNTYKHKGLPPTPICNPSAASIYASVNPEDTDFLFFVANGNGGHNFSHTYKEHKKRIKDWVQGMAK